MKPHVNITMARTTTSAKELSSFPKGQSLPTAPSSSTFRARLRFYWTIFLSALLFVVIGVPAILAGYLLRWIFGIENFVFPYAQFGVRVYVRSTGARVHVSGRENVDSQKTYLFLGNHQSMLDPPIMFAYLGCRIGALAKKELRKFPILGQGMSLAHVIPVDRGDHERALEATRAGAEALRQGHSL